MARCRVDTSIERKEVKGFAFPLGVYPIEDMTPKEGYALWFEPADESDGTKNKIIDRTILSSTTV